MTNLNKIAMPAHGHFVPNRDYLVTYPRSGANWVRYIIEVISGRPTMGVSPLHIKGPLDKPVEQVIRENFNETLDVNLDTDPILQHSHKWEVNDSSNRVVKILRNYKEVLVREYFVYKGKSYLKRMLHQNHIKLIQDPESMPRYTNTLQRFHDHEGPKCLVYYEDLKLQPKETIEKLMKFLLESKYQQKVVDKFIKKLKIHENISLMVYSTTTSRSFTQGKKENLFQHSEGYLNDTIKLSWQNYFQDNYPDLYQYVERYNE